MTTTTSTNYAYDRRAILGIETTGSVVEAALGIAVIVLAIIGIAQAGNTFLGSIAAIVLGVALMAQGGAIAAEYSKLLTTVTGGAAGALQMGSSVTAEMLAGLATIVLGILGLIGFAPTVLISAAVIAVGASLLLSINGLQRLNSVKLQAAGLGELAQKTAEAAVAGSVTTQMLAGVAAIVLGILALTIPAHGTILMLVALIVLGAAVAISGTTLTGRMLRMFEPQ
jgi:hypothetical protein